MKAAGGCIELCKNEEDRDLLRRYLGILEEGVLESKRVRGC